MCELSRMAGTMQGANSMQCKQQWIEMATDEYGLWLCVVCCFLFCCFCVPFICVDARDYKLPNKILTKPTDSKPCAWEPRPQLGSTPSGLYKSSVCHRCSPVLLPLQALGLQKYCFWLQCRAQKPICEKKLTFCELMLTFANSCELQLTCC